MTQISNGPIGSFHEKIEAPLDPTKELSRLVYEHKYDAAFTAALQRNDVWIVSWLCSQVMLFATSTGSTKVAQKLVDDAKIFKGKLIFVHVGVDSEDVGKPVRRLFWHHGRCSSS